MQMMYRPHFRIPRNSILTQFFYDPLFKCQDINIFFNLELSRMKRRSLKYHLHNMGALKDPCVA